MQALYWLGLDPLAESQADGHSYGFRLERRCADAMAQTHVVLSHRHGPQGILEGDIKACFDKISHDWLLTHVPMDRQMLARIPIRLYTANRIGYDSSVFPGFCGILCNFFPSLVY
jgi:RNA-directed DNA polymerase